MIFLFIISSLAVISLDRVASAAVSFKAAILLLWNHCLLSLPLFVCVCVCLCWVLDL